MVELVERSRAWLLGSLAAIAVVAFTAGSSSLAQVKHLGHTVRWVVLVVLCVAALAEILPRLLRDGLPSAVRTFAWLPTAFIALCFLSAAWSPVPRLTVERSASLALLFLAAGALALLVASDPRALRRLLSGLAAGAGIVALIGFAMLAGGAKAAAQAATPETPWRFRGFGENPNTVAVLAGVILPIVGWLAVTSGGRRRAGWLVVFAVLLASTIASGSRGGLAAALGGVEVVVLTTVPRWDRRLLVGIAYGLLVVGGIALREVTQPAPPAFHSAIPKPPPAAVQGLGEGIPQVSTGKNGGGGGGSTGKNGGGGGGTAVAPVKHVLKVRPHGAPMQPLPLRVTEIGHPLLSREGTTAIGSGRVAAWLGTLKDVVARRPLLGYGFGTEETVFVDRWYGFQGGTPENSIVGLLLQVGIVGLLLIVSIAAVVVTTTVRSLRGGGPQERVAASVGLGVVASALVLTLFQSYVYSVGNVATLTVWVVLFIAAASTLRGRAARRA